MRGIIKTFASASPTFVECLNVVSPETKMRVTRVEEIMRNAGKREDSEQLSPDDIDL